MIHALSYRKSGMSLSRFKHDPEIYHAGLMLAIIKCNLCKLTSESITNDKTADSYYKATDKDNTTTTNNKQTKQQI